MKISGNGHKNTNYKAPASPILSIYSGLQIRVRIVKLFYIFLIPNICCGYSSVDSFEHPKHMLKLIGKKIITILL